VRLLIAIPAYEHIATDCARSLAMMTLRLGADPPEGMCWFGIETVSSSNLPESRHQLAMRALRVHEATHILWVDSDMAFPQDSLHRLIAHDLDMVGANYPRRMGTHNSSAIGLDNVPFPPDRKGVEEASVIGFGLFLTRAHVFEGTPMPLFAHHNNLGYCTEDVTFCDIQRHECGRKIWVDHDLSREVRHMSIKWIGHEDMKAAEPGYHGAAFPPIEG
jgi:hypothetical protein